MKARLLLSNGKVFTGESFGYEGDSSGEVVFNTGMTGYPESLTDPSYKGQILTLTYPLSGNYGIPEINEEDFFGLKKHFESDKIHLSGLIVSEYSENYNHFQASKSLSNFLKSQKVPAITGIDTRELTKTLRKKGVMLGKIIVGNKRIKKDEGIEDPNFKNLVAEVSTKEVKVYGKGKKKICLVDMGVKNNIIRSLLKHDTTIYRVPHNYKFMEEDIEFDGLFISNGPGNPEMNTTAIKQTKIAIEKDINIFGICLGNQIIALASGMKTYKLKFGHRGQNHPCRDLISGKCVIISQNHQYAIEDKNMPRNIKRWFENINDDTNEGIYYTDKNIRSVQFHPESFPGPNDSAYLFKDFIDSL